MPRITIVLDEDVAAAVARLQAERSVGLSEAVNELVRRGLQAAPRPRRYVQRSMPMGLRIDVTHVQDALDQIDGPAAR